MTETTKPTGELTELLFRCGTLIELNVGRPTFQRKLKASDICMEAEQINEEAIYLGHKKLLPKEAMEELVTIEGRARTYLAAHSIDFPISRARFVSYKVLADVLTKLEEFQTAYQAAAQTLAINYSALREQQLAVLRNQARDFVNAKLASMSEEQRKEERPKLTDWEEAQGKLNSSLYPQESELAPLFYIHWKRFHVSTAPNDEELAVLTEQQLLASEQQMKAEIRDWTQQAMRDMHLALGQAAKQARAMFEKHGKINPKNLRPLFEAFETFSAIDFTGSSDWRKQVQEAREMYIKRDAAGNIDFEKTATMINCTSYAGTEFKALLDSVGSLAVEQTAEEAGMNAISHVGEFRRLIEI